MKNPAEPAAVMLKPAVPGTLCRDPETRVPLPDAGAPVVLNTYWRRRLRDGSVLQVKTSAPKSAGK